MGRGQQQQGRTGGREMVGSSGRRAFLGVGIGCVVPLILGARVVGAESLVASVQEGGISDPLWEHIATEAWRTCRDVLGSRGASGEQVRRLASQVDLFAVHLHGTGVDGRVDAGVRRMVRERGRESVALEMIERHREVPGIHPGTSRDVSGVALDPGRVGTCLDEILSRGMVKTLRCRRPLLERAAARLDREASARSGRVLPAGAPGQKPGDDFLGYPEVPPPDLCELLDFIVVGCTVAAVALAAGGQLEALPAVQALQAACEALRYAYCRNAATCAD